jgi:hypothetical protein
MTVVRPDSTKLQALAMKWRDQARRHREAMADITDKNDTEYYLHRERALAFEQCASELNYELTR